MVEILELASILAEIAMQVVAAGLESSDPYMGFGHDIGEDSLFALSGGLSVEFGKELD